MRYMIGLNKVTAMMTGVAMFSMPENSSEVTAHYTDGTTESAAVSADSVAAIKAAVDFQRRKSNTSASVNVFALLSEVQTAARKA